MYQEVPKLASAESLSLYDVSVLISNRNLKD